MAQLTPNEILEISEPIEAIYQRTVDDLLINIARHFEISGWERTRYWEIKKLSEMGALTKESAAIIAKNTQMLPAEIEKAFLQVSEKACLDIDPQLRKAASEGILQDPQTSPSTSLLMRRDVQSFVDQAVDKMNMTNTTMLASTQQAYLKGITSVVNDVQLAEAKLALEAGALAVTTGVETRTMAIRKAMNQLAATGITGFYDRAGRKWSADAYAAMVIRTTAHNAAISAIRTRQMEFGGGDIFQVSSHPGARPLCYPYQGKFFSWSGEGIFTDGAGRQHEYKNIDESSYGEPAGLFGINCGHHPIPMIDGFSYPQDGPEETPEENRKEYGESQKQRQYEREIREAKRDLEIAKATGDTEAIKAAEQKVAQKQANMRAYTKDTGRPRRYDREQIAGSKIPEGYRGWRAEQNSDLPLSGAKASSDITKANAKGQSTLEAAYENHRTRNNTQSVPLSELPEGVVKANYGKLSTETADAFNATIGALSEKYDTPLTTIRTMSKTEVFGRETVFATTYHDYTTDVATIMINPLKCKDASALGKRIGELSEDGFGIKIIPGREMEYVPTHEFAHTLLNFEEKLNDKTNWVGANYDVIRAARSEIEPIFDRYMDEVGKLSAIADDLELQSITAQTVDEMDRLGKLAIEAMDKRDAVKLSDYSLTNIDEFFAEAFTNEQIGATSNPYAKEVMDIVEKYFGR